MDWRKDGMCDFYLSNRSLNFPLQRSKYVALSRNTRYLFHVYDLTAATMCISRFISLLSQARYRTFQYSLTFTYDHVRFIDSMNRLSVAIHAKIIIITFLVLPVVGAQCLDCIRSVSVWHYHLSIGWVINKSFLLCCGPSRQSNVGNSTWAQCRVLDWLCEMST